jgi:hypothetical protein
VTVLVWDESSFVVRVRAQALARQRRGRTGRGASLRRSALRADCPAMLCLVARRRTRCAHYAQTTATSQTTKLVARDAGAPRCGLSGGRYPPGAISGATTTKLRRRVISAKRLLAGANSAAPGSARASALRCLTRRSCLNAVSAANEVSSAARPRCEQRSAVGAQRRPPQHEPLAGTACRDALTVASKLANGPPSRACC